MKKNHMQARIQGGVWVYTPVQLAPPKSDTSPQFILLASYNVYCVLPCS